MKVLLIIPLLISTLLPACGQDNDYDRSPSLKRSDTLAYLDSLDNALAEMYRMMWDNNDSLPYEFADTFEMRLEEVLRDPATFDYPFTALKDTTGLGGIEITESDDKNVRVFWWLHPHSGTWRHYPAIIQVRRPSGLLIVENMGPPDDEDWFPCLAYSSIYHLRDSTYLTIVFGQLWTGAIFETVEGMTLSDTGLVESSLKFHVADSVHSFICLDKNWYFNNMEKFDYILPLVVEYDTMAQVLSFPEILNIETGEFVNEVWVSEEIQPTGDTLHLRFNGVSFQQIKN